MSKGKSASAGGLVPYDKWGREIDTFNNRKPIYDENGNEVGSEHLEDHTHYDYVPVIQEATVSQVVRDINGWKMDDGTYGDDDTAMGVYYSDGSYIDSRDNDFEKRFAKNKRGIVGAWISTADYEAAAGTTGGRKNENVETSDVAGKAFSNSYVGYEAVGKRKIRQKVTYLAGSYAKAHGKKTFSRQTVKKSTTVPIEIPKKINNGYGKITSILRDNPL